MFEKIQEGDLAVLSGFCSYFDAIDSSNSGSASKRETDNLLSVYHDDVGSPFCKKKEAASPAKTSALAFGANQTWVIFTSSIA